MSVQSSEAFDSHLVREAGDLWEKATHSPFLDGVRDGVLPQEAFHRWLVQDYHFVTAFLRFVGGVLLGSGRPQQTVLVHGITALGDELVWFEEHADLRGLELGSPLHPVCRRYNDFMLRAVHEESLPGLYSMLYGIEVSYYAAWSSLEPRGPYQEFIERWSHSAFRDYVIRLKSLAESETDATSQRLFNDVLRHEEVFWSMTTNG